MKTIPLILAAAAAAALPVRAQSADPIQKSMQFSNEGRHGEAVRILEEAAAAEPGNEALSFRLATALVFERRPAEARVRFEQLSRSWDSQIASMAASSLAALDKAEAEERIALAAPPSAEQIRREREYAERKARLDRQQAAYDLAASGSDAEAVAAIGALEARGEALPDMVRAKAAALDRLGDTAGAVEVLRRLCETENPARETRAQLAALLRREGDHEEAFGIWQDLRDNHGDTDEGRMAAREIAALAPPLNLERWSWGELDLYTAYLSRYGIGVGGGRLRQGTFVPGARWIEPFVQADFTLDSSSAVSNQGIATIYNENLAGFHAGARIRPFADQSFTLYVLGGVQNNLRGVDRYPGIWFAELVTGLNGFWAWGPGKEWAFADLETVSPGGMPPLPPDGVNWIPHAWGPVSARFDWFTEAGFDASYYTRLSDCIGYVQARQGFRLLQLGRAGAVDAYALANAAMDTGGSYYDNYFEGGPGMRFVAAPVGAAIFTTSLDYVLGAYLGPNAGDSRGSARATYSDFRITASLSLRW
jgi:thioredoxin-like negative regulator of GroEL